MPGYAAIVDDVKTYYGESMKLLNFDVREQLFGKENKIYTKVKDSVPTIYQANAKVKNSLIADGCIINGTVENSILFRNVRIEEGAVVKNSIIMESGVVQKDASLQYAITDKDVTISESRNISGFITYPIVIVKGKQYRKRGKQNENLICHKRGRAFHQNRRTGRCERSFAYCSCQRKNRRKGCVASPHEGIPSKYRHTMEFIGSTVVALGWRHQYAGVFTQTINGVKYYFVDNEYYFKREGLYGHFDDGERFAFFSKAMLDIIPLIDFIPMSFIATIGRQRLFRL